MKRVVFFLLLFIIIISCGEKSHERRSNELSLNGTWQFLTSNEIGLEQVFYEEDYSKWDTIQVPGNWDTRERYSEFVGQGYYQKEFELPKEWKNKQIRLKFDAVYETVKVWLNGSFLGEHVGGYTPFEFNITNKVDFSKSNTVIVMADNTYKRGAWWAWGGISRAVSLVANEDIRIAHQHMAAVPDFESNKVNFAITYKIENNGVNEAVVNLNSEILGVHSGELSVRLKPNSETVSSLKFEKPLSDIQLWHFNAPNLYELKSKAMLNGVEVDEVSDKFGIRKFEVRGAQFFLNNDPVRLNGVNRIHDHPIYGNTEPDHLVLQDMLDIKHNLGCNFSRLMHAPLSENLLRICDSIGFLVVEEIPVWGDDDPQAYPNNPQTKLWLKEMIERDYNHPSVVAWSVGNELRDPNAPWPEKTLTNRQYNYVNSMLDYIEELDTTRLKTYVSLSTYRNGTIENEPYDKLDFISINSYGNVVEHAKITNKKFPNKPIFISELGKSQIGPAPHATLDDELLTSIMALKNLPYVSGVSLWSYNDYRSNYEGTPQSGFREWGIVDERRNKKEAYVQLKESYAYWNDN